MVPSGPARLTALLLLLASDPALALRCANGLIDTGDRRQQVIEACGEPDFIDRRPVFLNALGHAVPGVEEWYYNPGSQRLINVIVLRSGRVQALRTDGRGLAGEPPRACGPYDIRPSMSKFRLLWECGEPADRRGYFVYRPIDPLAPTGRVTAVLFEEWIYRFGPQQLDRQVQLENGQVIDIDVPD